MFVDSKIIVLEEHLYLLNLGTGFFSASVSRINIWKHQTQIIPPEKKLKINISVNILVRPVSGKVRHSQFSAVPNL